MAKIPDTPTAPRLCPTCGTRAGAAATKCLVCGADLTSTATPARGRAGDVPGRAVSASVRGPSAWLFVVLLIVLILAGAGLVLFAYGKIPAVMITSTPTTTPTFPPLPTFTATPTATDTLEPSPTPLPPTPYVVKTGDQCGIIAANFDVSIASIIATNHLDPNCLLTVGKTILIPQPTPTPTSLPTATLPGGLATVPPPFTHTVVSGETCGGIAKAFKINLADLIAENGLKADCSIRPGQVLVVPFPAPVGPTPTPTLPPLPGSSISSRSSLASITSV